MFNASYSFDLGNRVRGDFFGSRIVKGVANGWMLAGITQWQSGTPFEAMKGSNLGFGTWRTILNTYNYGGTGQNSGSQTVQMSSANMLGTTDVALQPYVKAGCDPTKGHGANSVFNTDCWIVPNFMQNGPVWKGYFRAPGYFSSDLTMSKSFRVAERKTVQFKASAFNFLNHPLQSFNGNDYSGNSDSLSVLNAPAAGYFTPGQQLQPTDFLYNTNGTDPNFVGKPHIKKGNRLIMLGLKFEF
jgi:hypothetical protein